MINDPPVLVLDEPTSGLDPLQIRETLHAIRDLAGSHTVLLSTHILSEVEAICDRVIIINQGTLRWDGKLSSLARQDAVVVLEVRGPATEVAALLENEPGVGIVKLVSTDKNVSHFEIGMAHGVDLREAIAQRVVEKGWAIRQLDLRRQRLDDLYMNVVLRGGAAISGPVAS